MHDDDDGRRYGDHHEVVQDDADRGVDPEGRDGHDGGHCGGDEGHCGREGGVEDGLGGAAVGEVETGVQVLCERKERKERKGIVLAFV